MSSLICQATQWWSARAPRERWMLGTMFVLIGAFVLWYGVLLPLDKWRLLSQREYDQAAAQLQAIQQALGPPQGGARAPVSLARIESSAKAAGLQLQRDAQGAGPLAFRIEGASAQAVFGWLDSLREEGAAPLSLHVARSEDGLQARVVFAGAVP